MATNPQWHIRRGQQVHGPFAATAIRQFATSGKLQPTDELSPTTEGPWKKASSFGGLFLQPSSNSIADVATPQKAGSPRTFYVILGATLSMGLMICGAVVWLTARELSAPESAPKHAPSHEALLVSTASPSDGVANQGDALDQPLSIACDSDAIAARPSSPQEAPEQAESLLTPEQAKALVDQAKEQTIRVNATVDGG
jgi:GYF domain 2